MKTGGILLIPLPEFSPARRQGAGPVQALSEHQRVPDFSEPHLSKSMYFLSLTELGLHIFVFKVNE